MSRILLRFFLIILENFKLLLFIKLLLIKKRVNSNLNADRSIPLANQITKSFTVP